MKTKSVDTPKITGTQRTEISPRPKKPRAKSDPGFVRASTPKEERHPIGNGGGQLAELHLRLADPINRVVASAEPNTLPAGMRLYSCASENAMRSILQHGILVDPPENNFGDPEMGTGLYVDTEGGVYRDGVKQLLVLEVVQDLKGVSTKPLEEYRREGALPGPEIEAGYRKLQNEHAFLRHAGAPPADTELVLRRTEQRLRVVGVVEDPGWDIHVPTDRDITPVDRYCRDHHIQLHESWKPRMFKAARGREAELVCHAEVGATALANLLLPQPLVPRAELAAVDGKPGTSQPFVPHQRLMEHDAGGFVTRDFDPTRLTQKQVDQMYAHMLVDWVLSNHDDHPLQFGIAANGDLMAFDKAQSYKYFRKPYGPEAGGVNSPFEIQKDPSISAYAKLLEAIADGSVRPNLSSEIIQETVFRIATLTFQDVERCLGNYADRAFPGRERAFFRDVVNRAHAIPNMVINSQ